MGICHVFLFFLFLGFGEGSSIISDLFLQFQTFRVFTSHHQMSHKCFSYKLQTALHLKCFNWSAILYSGHQRAKLDKCHYTKRKIISILFFTPDKLMLLKFIGGRGCSLRRFVSVRGFKECLGPRRDVTTDYRWYKINIEDKALLWADSWKTISKCCIGNCLPLSGAGMPHFHT